MWTRALIVISFLAVSVQAQDVNNKNSAPVVENWSPRTASVGTVIYLTGYRLGPDQGDKAKAFVIQKGIEHPARTAGGWWTTNNQNNLPQTMGVIIPDEVGPGSAQVIVELEGRRSAPVAITVTEWKLPTVKTLSPSRGAPGTFVRIEGEGFLFENEIELTDDKGTSTTFNSSGSPDGTTFRIPTNAAEGVITVRVGNQQYGKGQYTQPLTFTVTNEPLPVELLASDSIAVAPGQWLDLQVSNAEPLNRSELTELAFKQAGRTVIVSAPKPFRSHFPVPAALTPGEVELQLRTWRDGRPSQWSEPAKLELADKPVAPLIDSIRSDQETWQSLHPGPDRKTDFTVEAGDEVVMNGLWPVADVTKLKVTLVSAGEVITMSATEVDGKRDWFADIKVRLPLSLRVGDWRMIVSSETDGTQTELPIVIKVAK